MAKWIFLELKRFIPKSTVNVILVIAVIDHDILGWGNENIQKILESYESIKKVSEDEDLPRRSSDAKLGVYCKDHTCDFFTADARAYTYFFEDKRIHNVQISKFDWWETGDRPIYLVKILS